jgi:hypothetical protein
MQLLFRFLILVVVSYNKFFITALKFGSWVLSNGMVGEMQDCEVGGRHDEVLVTTSGINNRW